jgi:hypothetical protein
MKHGWLAVAVMFDRLFFDLVFLGAFGRITWRNRCRTLVFLGGLFTIIVFAITDLTALVAFLQADV